MRVASRLDSIENRLRVTGKNRGIHTPVIYDPENPDLFFVNGIEMTKSELDELRKNDDSQGVVIFIPKCLERKQV